MKVRFGFVLVLLSASFAGYCANRYVVVNDGNWNDASTWSATPGGTGGIGVPTASDDVFTNGRRVVVNVNNATCRNIFVSYDIANSVTFNGATSVLTVTGTLTGWDDIGALEEFPTVATMSFVTGARIIFTGANVSTYAPYVIYFWSETAPLGRVHFNFGTGNTFSTLPALTFGTLARIESGTLETDAGSYLNGASASLTIVEGAFLITDDPLGPFSTIGVSGSLVATSSIDVNTLTIGANGTLNSSGTISISGNLTNSGTISGNNLTFDGSSQSLSGNAFDVLNMTVSSGATVANDGNVGVIGTLTLLGTGTFDSDGSSNNGVLRLVSTSLTETGRIATLPDPNLFTGTVTIQRFIDGPDAWRYLAMPVSNGTVATWQSAEFPVTGNFSNPSPVDTDVVAPSEPSIYYWDGDNQEWVAVGDGSATEATSMPNNIGYSAWSYRTTNVVLSSTGTINKGSIQTTLGIGNGPDGPGWNLIPNPYPSQIDWDNVDIPVEMDAAISVQRKNENAFAYYNPNCGCPPTDPPTGISNWTGEIAVGQSFWVSASSAENPVQLTFNESDKTSQEAEYIREREQKYYFKMVLASASQHDEVIVWFGDEPSRDFDPKFDAKKRTNYNYLNFSTFMDDPLKDLAINGLPKIACSENIGLRVRNVSSGNYSLTFKDIDKLYLGYTIKLIDHFTAQEMIAENNSKYDFAVTADPASYGSSRFELEISAPEINDEVSPSFTDLKECDDQSVKVKLTNAQAGVMYQLWSGGTAVSDLVTSEGEEVVLIIPKSNIQYGGNVLSLNAETVGQCSSHIFGDAINYVLAEEPEVSAVTAAQHCGPGTVTLSAEGAQANGLYKWYEDSEGTTLLQASNQPSFTTPELIKSKSYFVSVVNESGCESPLVPAEAAIVYVEKPIIAVDGMTLISSSASGNQWFKDGVALTGETAAVLEVTASGDYSVEVTENGCNALSDPLSFVVTDVSEQMRSGVRFYPNPIDDKLIVELPAELAPMVRRVAVYDAKGVEVMVEEDVIRIKSGTFELDFSEKKAGNYIMNILSDKAIIALRLIRK